MIGRRALAAFIALVAFVPASRAETPAPLDPADRSAASSLVGRRLALVVGTSDYTAASAWPRLPNATGDAQALGDELAARYGFLVQRLESPTLASFKSAVSKLAEEAGPADDLLLFVAGHGYFDAEDKAGYLVFKDAAAACASGCYPLDNVKRALYDTRARHALVMLDACYAGTFEIRTALDSGVAREGLLEVPLKQSLRDYARYPSRLLFASIGKATTADGAPGSHSPFMRAVLRELAQPGATGVVSLDRLFVALAEDESLPVSRPSPFTSAVPAHPSGTFLFIEEVALCDALEAFLAAGADGFGAVRQGDGVAASWGEVAPATWTLPGARRCEVWRWRDDPRSPHDEVRCDLGPYDRSLASAKAHETFVALKACSAQAPSVPSERVRSHGPNEFGDLVLELPSRGRAITVSSLCADRLCTLTVVVE